MDGMNEFLYIPFYYIYKQFIVQLYNKFCCTHCNLRCLLKKDVCPLLFFITLFLDSLVISAKTLALVRSPTHIH